jgi:hypothetical protein
LLSFIGKRTEIMALDQFRLKTAFKAAAEHCKKNARSGLTIALMVACGATALSGFGLPMLGVFFAAAATGSMGVPAAQAGYKAYKAAAPAPAAPTA